MRYTLREVTDKVLEKEFIELPKRLYKGNRNWVCPLDDDIKSVFDPATNNLILLIVRYPTNSFAIGKELILRRVKYRLDVII